MVHSRGMLLFGHKGSLYQIDTLGGIGSFNDADTIGRDDSLK